MAGLLSLRPDFWFSAEFDWKNKQISPKDFDLYFFKNNTAIEFYSPIREAVPLVRITEEMSDEIIHQKFNQSIRYGNAQSISLVTICNTKLTSKNAFNFDGNIILLVDTYKNDHLEDYFGRGALNIEKIKKDFRENWVSKNSNFAVNNNLIIAVVKRGKWFFNSIHLLSLTDSKQKKFIKSIFWMSKISF